MNMNFDISKAVLCRYAEVVSKIAEDDLDIEKEVWNREMTLEKEAGPFTIKMQESFHAVNSDGSIDRVVHAELGIKDDYIYDLVDVLDKQGDSLKKIVLGAISIVKGFSSLLSGLKADIDKVTKKYIVSEEDKEEEQAAG